MLNVLNKPVCPLCGSLSSVSIDDQYSLCNECRGLYRKRELLLDHDAEKQRYTEHNNDVNDPRYQKFVAPITDFVRQNFAVEQIGLDFGSGTGPVVSKVLTDSGYHIHQYDPFFSDNSELLADRYDFIVCCEVIEHFNSPAQEFEKLYHLLSEHGHLICMTHIYNAVLDFRNWYYRNDPTHVFIYQKETLHYIEKLFGLKLLSSDGRLVIFKK